MDMMWYRRRGLMVTPHIESVTGAIASFNSDYNKIPIKSLICDIEPIQEGTGDPSPENVRPISGRTGVSVVRSGKNLLDTKLYDGISYNPTIGRTVSLIESADVLTDKGDGEFQLSFTSTWKSRSFIVPVVKGISYHVYCKFTTDSNVATSYGLLDENYTVLSCYNDGYAAVGSIAKNLTFETTALPSDRGYFYLLFTNRTAANAVIDISKPQVELGSTATDYEPYKGSTYSVNWETEAGTVYGGTLNVSTGELVVDRVADALTGQENMGAVDIYYAVTNTHAHPVWTAANVVCSHFAQSGTNSVASGNVPTNVWFRLDKTVADFATLEAFRSYIANQYTAETPVTVSYKLTTPITYTLTQQEIRTLLGVNNIWCDSGDVSVDYWKWGK